ncbi:leucine-rich repeat and WD repeat-containing protein 1-like isoform X1 [Dinothrombium tinctorium]|uniref:Leucine-rich repeat and WD repeat-containing protein 1 n=1 Tax=Dinothrombium tinctorium TaxID=1965070 RepID=A0A3S3SGP2_9ACAR|nr:leucine-rich repeat and WD repeat-containing protein 1-like isoform X1 [Dinothrombium tinctorium]
MQLNRELIAKCVQSEALESVHSLNLSKQNITDIAANAFDELVSLQSLDLSNNRLKTFTAEKLCARLKKLDLCDNEIRDVSFLSNFPAIERLSIAGNPLHTTDRLLIVAMLPNLTFLDGNDCSALREVISKLDLDIDKKIDAFWQKELSNALDSASFDCGNLESRLARLVRQNATDCPESAKKVLNYLLENKVKQKVEEEFKTLKARFNRKANETSNESDACSDQTVCSVCDTPSSEVCSKKREQEEHSIEGVKPKKRCFYIRKENSSFDYEAVLFIRCHSSQNNPYDSTTQIWKTAFEPKTRQSNGCNLVASCGGNIVCLIDCPTATVKKRYCDSNLSENFYCMAWTAIPSNGKSEDVILAVGGRERHIVLLHPDELICYCKFVAHDKDVNALLFHPKNPTWLFSASYDKTIKLWDIGKPTRHQAKVKLLRHVNAFNFLLQLVFSPEYDVLLAAGENGLTFWPNFSNEKREPQLGHVSFSKHKVIDGLAIFPENREFVAVKRSRSGVIDVINLKRLLDDFTTAPTRNKTSSFKETPFKSCYQFEYCESICDYMYLTVQQGLMVCGDNDGQLWLYDTSKIPFDDLEGSKKQPPDLVLKWPTINNPKLNDKKIVNEKQPVVINAVAVSPDLEFIVAATNINLVCLWKRSTDS